MTKLWSLVIILLTAIPTTVEAARFSDGLMQIQGLVDTQDETRGWLGPGQDQQTVPREKVSQLDTQTVLSPDPAPQKAQQSISSVDEIAFDPLAFNSWCFNVLANQGSRFSYPNDTARMQAAFAMADAAGRYARLSKATGIEGAGLVAYDQAMVAQTAPIAKRASNGTLTGAELALYDACMANGSHGTRIKALYVDPNGGMHERLWCGDTLTLLNQRGLIQGGAEQVAHAQLAIRAAELVQTQVLEFLGVPPTDQNTLRMGYLYLALVQVEAFTQAGDRGKFEADPSICLGLAALELADDQSHPPQPISDRPAITAAGWDYPLSAEFRFNAWCYGAMHYLTDGNMPADSNLDVAEAESLIGDLHFRLLREAKGLGLSDDILAEMEVESYHQAAYEFSRPLTNAGQFPLSHDYESCTRAEVDIGALLDVDDLQALVESWSNPPSETMPDSEFTDTIWCIAGLERVLGSETDREKRAALKEGIESLSNRAAWLGSERGLSRDVVMARVAGMQPTVDEEIRDLRIDDGKLKIAVCLERALGYSDEFYDWVDP